MHSEDYDHIVLLAHGSTDSAWKVPFESLQETVEKQYGTGRTTLAFMELSEPSLETVLTGLSEGNSAGLSKKHKRVGVLPLFLAVGRHLRHDVPEQIRTLTPEGMTVDLLAPIGDYDVLQKAILDIIAKQLGE